MKVSLQWLNKYVDLTDVSVEQIAEALPMLGLEVEDIQTTGIKKLDNVVVGEILSREKHPDSDHLGVCMVKVALDKEPTQVVCGASNYKVGDRVPVALDGAELPTPEGGVFKIKVSKLRGVTSNGMMCSARELGLGGDHSGLLILQNNPQIGTPINEVFSDSDTVFNIELTANRGDCLSHIGVARELAAKFGKKLKMPELKYSPKYADKPAGGLLKSVTLQTQHCPLYTAASIKGVKIGKSPEWLQRDLEAVGLRSINNVVDVTNFVMLEYGQPLHAFDARDLRGNEIVVRKASQGEKMQTLDGKEYLLTPEVTLICDAEGGVAIAGVMGGLNSEVKDDTSDVVLESAYFNAGNTRATSRKYSIHTDASYRYARDVDPQSVFDASRRAVDLIIETAGGSVEEITCLAGKAPRADRTIEISLEYIVGQIGFGVSKEEVSDAFIRLGFGVKEVSDGKWEVLVPSFRSEVDRPIDLVEEFVRIWGSEKLPDCELKSVASIRDDDPLYKYNYSVTDFLAARGLNECKHYTLEDSAKLSKIHQNIDAIKLANPLTSDQDCLRVSLLDGLLDIAWLNFSNGNSFAGFFENGKIFKADESGEILELCSTAFILAPDCGDRKWAGRASSDFFATKSLMFDALSILGINAQNLAFKPLGGGLWQEGFAAEFGSEKREGFQIKFGAINLAHLRERGIEKVLWGAEVTFKPEVAARKKTSTKFKAFSQFPSATRDIALIVPAEKPASEVYSEITRAAKAKIKGKNFEIESIKLFDKYVGKGVENGFKSLGYALTFRSDEKTLQTEEINEVFEDICAELAKKFTIRS